MLENGRLRNDGNTVPNQTQNSSEQLVHWYSWFKIHPGENEVFLVEKHEDESGSWQWAMATKTEQTQLPFTIAAPANSPLFQTFKNENENFHFISFYDIYTG